MRYMVRKISCEKEICQCERFEIKNLLWGTKSIPQTYGFMGVIPEQGFYIEIFCEETNPLAVYKENNEPVYKDSAVEVFLQLSDGQGLSPVYLNFEMNANGALLAGFGEERKNRKSFSADEMKYFCCEAEQGMTGWKICLHIPGCILKKVYGMVHLESGTRMACNFYKISETKSIEHYASFSPIVSESPSFHLPEYFAKAVIE